MKTEKPINRRELRMQEKKEQMRAAKEEQDFQKELATRKYIRDLRSTKLHIDRLKLFIDRKEEQIKEGIWEVVQEGEHVYTDVKKTKAIIAHEIDGLKSYILEQLDTIYEISKRLQAWTNADVVLSVLESVGFKDHPETEHIIKALQEQVMIDEENNKK